MNVDRAAWLLAQVKATPAERLHLHEGDLVRIIKWAQGARSTTKQSRLAELDDIYREASSLLADAQASNGMRRRGAEAPQYFRKVRLHVVTPPRRKP